MKNIDNFYLRFLPLPLLFLGVTSPLHASDELYKELDSGKVVQKIIPISDEEQVSAYAYKRNRIKDPQYDSSYPDYFYMWHGQHMSAYPFMNLTTLMSNNVTQNKQKALFFAVDDGDGMWSELPLSANLLKAFSSNYSSQSGVKREISVGYDTGVAAAYKFACEMELDFVVASAGGVFESEDCKPSNLEMVYVLNTNDRHYPLNQSSSMKLASVEWTGLTDRLDGVGSINRLKKLMGCSKGATMDALISEHVDYTCTRGNRLSVIKTNTHNHQWNGYSNVEDGAYHQYGQPVSPKMTHWMRTILGIK